MATPTTKQKILDAVEHLPPGATIEDAMERLYVLAKIERGLEQLNSGDVVPHEEAKRRLLG